MNVFLVYYVLAVQIRFFRLVLLSLYQVIKIVCIEHGFYLYSDIRSM
jgi:hypothetical protein